MEKTYIAGHWGKNQMQVSPLSPADYAQLNRFVMTTKSGKYNECQLKCERVQYTHIPWESWAEMRERVF